MTNTDTEDLDSTIKQILELHKAGSEIVRLTVNTKKQQKILVKLKKSYLILIVMFL